MPSKPATPCKKPECTGLVRDGKCSKCGPVRRYTSWASKEYDQRRGTPAQRGYGTAWQKLRRMVLADNPLCTICKAEGRIVPATDVDHIIPKARGGDDSFENLQSLCSNCHKRKTGTEARMGGRYQTSRIPLTIVAGAPGSGKTTYVAEHKAIGDLVIDVDALFSALSGLPWYDKPIGLLPFVLEARDAVLRRLATESEVRRAWFITGEADVDKLKQLKEDLGAERLIVMDVSASECYKRIASDDRRADRIKGQKQLVDAWFSKFKPRDL